MTEGNQDEIIERITRLLDRELQRSQIDLRALNRDFFLAFSPIPNRGTFLEIPTSNDPVSWGGSAQERADQGNKVLHGASLILALF